MTAIYETKKNRKKSEIKCNTSNEPKDTYYFVYIVYYLLGISSLMCWTFFVTATEYWLYKFRDVSNENFSLSMERTYFQADFFSYMNIASALSSSLVLLWNSKYGHRWSLNLRMSSSLTLIFILFIIITCFVKINTDQWQYEFFIIVTIIVILLNGASAVFAGSLYGVAGTFPTTYLSAVVSGQGFSGIIAAITQILSLTFSVSPSQSALIYFLIANGMLLVSLVAFLMLRRLPFYIFYANKTDEITHLEKKQRNSIPYVVGKIPNYVFSICLLATVTCSVHPTVTALVISNYDATGTDWNTVYFTPVINFLLFSCGDYFGRLLAEYINKPKEKSWIVTAASVLRIAIIPLVLFCNGQPRENLPVLIHTDTVFIIIIAFIALSNGYLTNICFINGTRSVEDSNKEKASSIMIAVLGLGICIGASMSIVCVKLL